MDDALDVLRVGTWNLHGSAGPDLRRVVGALNAAEVEITGLQEVRAVHARRLAELLGWNVRWVFKHFPLTPALWWRAEGMAILSRHPITDSGRAVLTPSVSRWSHRRRMAQWCEIAHPSGRLRLVNVHLAASPDAATERVTQAERVAVLIDATSILTGDLNAPDATEVLAVFAACGLGEAWSGPGPGHTNPAGSIRQRLDHVLAASSFEVLSCTIPDDGPRWAELSDHLPVFARLRRRPVSRPTD